MQLGIEPNRIGMMGFSAGGHLAASTTVEMVSEQASTDDAIDKISSRPDFLILGYPWLEATVLREEGTSHYSELALHNKIACDATQYTDYLPLNYVAPLAPPTFIFHTTDDELVPVEGSIRFYQSLLQHGVNVELHAFQTGRHGAGLDGKSAELSMWTNLLDHWLRTNAFIGPVAVSGPSE